MGCNSGTTRLIACQSTIEVALAVMDVRQGICSDNPSQTLFRALMNRHGFGMLGREVLLIFKCTSKLQVFLGFSVHICVDLSAFSFSFAVGIFTFPFFSFIFIAFLDAHCIKAIFFSMRSHSWNIFCFTLFILRSTICFPPLT